MSDTVQRDVVVNVLKETASLSRPGFGTMLIAGYHTHFANRVKTYSQISELVTDGFAVTDPIYKAASIAKSQSPCVQQVKVGRLSAATMGHDVNISAVSNAVYTVTINGTAFSFTAGGTATLAEIITGLLTAINAGSQPVTAADGTTKLTLLADVAGTPYTLTVSDSLNQGLLTIKDTTPDRGIANDLNALIAEDDNWYGLVVADAFGAAEIAAIAAWVEPQARLCLQFSADSDCWDSGSTTDIMSILKSTSYERTPCVYKADYGYINAAVMGRLFATDPGTSNTAHKNHPGVAADVLSTAQLDAIEAKNGSHYVAAGGQGRFRYGKVPSGDFIDIVRNTDWLQSEATFDIYQAFASNENVPFDQAGAVMLGSILEATLRRGIRAGVLAPDPDVTVTVPDVLDATQVTAQNRLDRVLPGIQATARYAGAIIRATLTLRLGA